MNGILAPEAAQGMDHEISENRNEATREILAPCERQRVSGFLHSTFCSPFPISSNQN
jgi:hypothetical protein